MPSWNSSRKLYRTLLARVYPFVRHRKQENMSVESSVARTQDSSCKGRGFKSRQELRETSFVLSSFFSFFLLLFLGQLSMLTLISVSVPPPCVCVRACVCVCARARMKETGCVVLEGVKGMAEIKHVVQQHVFLRLQSGSWLFSLHPLSFTLHPWRCSAPSLPPSPHSPTPPTQPPTRPTRTLNTRTHQLRKQASGQGGVHV